ncbi:hypothetical protein PMAYCL1PPCAC_08016, partial [Pristionchus mayeri]
RFSQRSTLGRHKKTHSEDLDSKLPYKCSHCAKRFGEKQNLDRHENTHLLDDDPRKKRFDCKICGKSFADPAALILHRKGHNEDEQVSRPYKCEECGWRCQNASILKKHMNSHLADDDPRKEKFKCDICGKEFSWERSLRIHSNTHKEEEMERLPYKCDYCAKRFMSSSHLCSHRKVEDSVRDRLSGGTRKRIPRTWTRNCLTNAVTVRKGLARSKIWIDMRIRTCWTTTLARRDSIARYAENRLLTLPRLFSIGKATT